MKFLFFIGFLISFSLHAQVVDDFADGDFTNNPIWMGDVSHFEVNPSFQLHLNNTVPDTSVLTTASTYINNAQWEFWVKLSFATSANNHGRVYIVSDQSNLKGPLNGYFVQLGDIGDGKDSLSLFKQSGLTTTKIIAGTIVYTNNSTNTFRVKVTRDNLGNWNLYSDASGGINYTLEGSGFDNTFTSSAYIGFFCKYTVSNSTKFYFDNFYAGPIIVDITPPTLTSLNVVSTTQLDVLFSENVETVSAQTVNNYSANNGLGNPTTAIKDGLNGSLVHLTFATPFTDGMINSLTVTNVKDLNNNTIVSVSQNFVYYIIKEFDVVINEIMADPDPPIGLPNYEFAELYNRTQFPLNLYNWTITLGSTVKVFPAITILPDSFLILTSTTAMPFFTSFGTVVDFSSFSLTNTGADVVLKNENGSIMSFVSYTDNWYIDNSKKDGGWSLEQIDPLNPCAGETNWRASADASGGTPGKLNSVNALNHDQIAPQLLRVAVVNSTTIQTWFTEPLDSNYINSVLNYSIDNSIGVPLSVNGVGPDYHSAVINLASPLQNNIIYKLTITDTLKDCVGNILALNSSCRFAIPQASTSGDIIVNEVLSNPNADGVDFVEIYNKSDKVFDLKTLTLSSFDTINQALSDINDISADNFLIFPMDYFVLTSEPAKVKQQYNSNNPNGFVQMASMPTLNNDYGNVVIANKSQLIIDHFTYTASMQFPLLNSTSGVSLERLCPQRPTTDITNWHSAAETAGFGTPGDKNSQYNCELITDDPITVLPEIFSPDNDGINDVLNISYTSDVPGMVATISIYDARGRMIRTLIKSEMLGTSGTFSWNGITDDNEKAPIGIYIIYVEMFNLKGNTKHYKKTAVLGGKL